MHPESPTWCAIICRSEYEFHVPHYLRCTYFSSDPSDRPSIDGAAGPSTSEVGPTNVPKPFPSDSSCDRVNSAKYTSSPLYFNSAEVGNEDRSVNADKVQVPNTACVLRGKVLQVDTKKKRKTRGIGLKLDICCFNVGLGEVTPDRCLSIGFELMFQPSRDDDYTTKDEGESCGGKDQDYIEGDEERPRSRTAIIWVF